MKLIFFLVLMSLLSLVVVYAGGGNGGGAAGGGPGGGGEGEQVILDNGYSQIAVSEFLLQWKVEGEMLRATIAAPTTGWIAVGFDPTSMMKDANIIIGYVTDGKTSIRDDFGSALTSHLPDEKSGGSVDITDPTGKEEDGATELSFTIPLNSGDSRDRVLVSGKEYRVILARGPDGSDDFDAYHAERVGVNIRL